MKLDFEKAKIELGLEKRKKVKALICEVSKKADSYSIRWKDKEKARGEIDKGGTTILYFEDHDNMIKILLKLGKKYVGELIPAEAIADELTKLHSDLKTNMLRPTGKYDKFYYTSLHLEHYLKNIIYLYKGEVFLDEGFYNEYGDGIPERPKRGLDRWLPQYR